MTNSPCTAGVVMVGTEQLHTVPINLLQQSCEGQWGHNCELKMTDQKSDQSEVFFSSTDIKLSVVSPVLSECFVNNSAVINTYRPPSGQKGSCLLS